MNLTLGKQKKTALWLIIGSILIAVLLSIILEPTPEYIKKARLKYQGESVCSDSFVQIERDFGKWRTVKGGNIGNKAETVYWIFSDINMKWRTIHVISLPGCYSIESIKTKD